jgi:large subunit ribosomal protein L13
MDCGDNVIIINADKVRISGNKKDQEVFYWHTGHPGGIKGRTQGQILEGKHPERVVENAVRRMLPKDSSLARQQYKNLRVYAGTEHPHEAQKPTVLDIATANAKNKRNA